MKANIQSAGFSYLIAVLAVILGINLTNAQQSGSKERSETFAKYKASQENQFFRNWYVIGPVVYSEKGKEPDAKAQEELFKRDDISDVKLSDSHIPENINIEDKVYSWKKVRSEKDILDFNKEVGEAEWAYAYAYAGIVAEQEQTLLLGVGSDDAVRVYVNGNKVHENFIGRGVIKDNDLIEVKLNKGLNRVLIKLQNFQYNWGFSFRFVGGQVLEEMLNESAGRGDLDNVELLLKYKAGLEWKSAGGLTAWQRAKVNGYEDLASILAENGAITDNEFPAISNYIESYVKSKLEEETPGIALLMAQNGNVLFKNSYGYANLKKKISVELDTKFRIGSVTKQFVAAGILKLHEQGRLSVGDKLSRYIPDFPRGDEVTIHHLLTHTSGIHSYTSQPDFMDNVTEKADINALIDSIKSWEYDFNPGEQWVYNNSGYLLLGEIIEIVSGMWYGDYLEEVFFMPLKMNNTGIYVNEQAPEKMALGYTFEDEKYTLAVDWNMSWAGGAGAMYSTVEDLFKWNEAIFNGEVLLEETLKKAHTSVRLNNGEKPTSGDYGYGWGIFDNRGVTHIAHSGGLHGFISYMTRISEKNITVVALTNTQPVIDGLDPSEISTLFAQYYLWEELNPKESKKTVEIDAAKLKQYIGRYDYGNSMVLSINEKNGKLIAQMTGQSEFELFPLAEDEFFWKVVDAKIKFVRNNKGEIIHGVHYQGGRELKVQKLPEIKTIEITEGKINAYIGTYRFNKDFEVEVTFSEGKLYIQATGQPKFELLQVEENSFVIKEAVIGIRFFEENGNYKLELNQGGSKNIIDKID